MYYQQSVKSMWCLPQTREAMMSDIAAALDQPVVGQGLVPGTLRDQLALGRTLLVFLRHNG
jgi:hypothetical protein